MKSKLQKIKALAEHPRTEPILAQEAKRVLDRLEAKDAVDHYYNQLTGKPLGPGSARR